VGLVYVDRLNDNLLGAFKQRELNLLAVLANSGAVAIVEAQRSLLLAENKELRDKLKPSPGLGRVVTQSREMENTLSLLTKVVGRCDDSNIMGDFGLKQGDIIREVNGTPAAAKGTTPYWPGFAKLAGDGEIVLKVQRDGTWVTLTTTAAVWKTLESYWMESVHVPD
jgi:hypothetical protein